VITAARELGIRIPEDLSIIGIDGHPLGEIFGLTTMNQHPSRQGSIAVSEALAQLGRAGAGSDISHLELGIDLVVRKSTASPR